MNIRKDLNYSRTIALNVLYIKEKEICSAYISEINSNCEKQIILLMILSELTLSSHEMLPKSVTSKHHGDFFVWIVFILLPQKTNLNLMNKYVKRKIFVELFCVLKKRKKKEEKY